MKVDILTREYPPYVYGGAGVHAEELSKVLAERVDVTVRAFDGPRTEADVPAIPGDGSAKGSLKVVGYGTPSELADANPALKTFGVDLQIANDVDADIAHAHTWYACLAGYLAKMLHGTPLVITAHSLEPFRPWKREQLGGGYNLSSWAEKDAYEHADRVIAVSGGMREDILAAYNAEELMEFYMLDMSVRGEYPPFTTAYLKAHDLYPQTEPEDAAALHASTPDFIGVNYYFSVCAKEKVGPVNYNQPPFWVSDVYDICDNPYLHKTEWMDKGVDPIGLHVGMRKIYDRYRLPMIVTENGMAYSETLGEDGKIHDPMRSRRTVPSTTRTASSICATISSS